MNETVRYFFKLGITGFGGPLAIIAMLEEEWVRRKKWITSDRFSEILSICKLLPGPVATQLAIFLGYEKGGRWVGAASGLAFIIPSFLMILGLSAAYFSSSGFAQASSLFLGMQVAALVVVLSSSTHLWKPYQKEVRPYFYLLMGLLLMIKAPQFEPLFLLTLGLLNIAIENQLSKKAAKTFEAGSLLWIGLSLFWTCFHAGAFTFGTGLAVIPLLEHDVVTHHQWMSPTEFLDGLAFGQITPGPVVITSTFIGYRVAGLYGACAATAGMFLPAFLLILFIVPLVWPKIAGTPYLRHFSRGAIPAVVGGILATSLKLFYPILSAHPATLVLALVVAILVIRFKTPPWAVIPLAGAALGCAHLLFNAL